MTQTINRQGIALGILTYSIWGFFPLFFKLYAGMPVEEVLVHRIVWSVAFLLVIVLVLRKWESVKAAFTNTHTLLRLLISSILLALNWLIFIYATLTNDVLQMSLGYFINPIFNVVFGVLIFKERLTIFAKVAISLALIGLSAQFFQLNHFPLLAISVAFLFSSYGVVRKSIPIDAISGLFVETLILLVPGLIYLYFFTESETIQRMGSSSYWAFMLMLIGPVTSIPLMTFSAAVRRIPYYLVGFCQYITPSMMFVWAIFLYDEAWTRLDVLTFSFVWAAVICVVIGALR